MVFEKVSGNGSFLYGLDLFRFQISIHTPKLDMPKNTSVGKNIRECPLRKYQTIVLSYKVWILLDSKYIKQWQIRKYQTMAFSYML